MFLTFQAFVLGLVQGVTEFLPVSSSGHLQAVPYLLGWQPGSLEFDVALHLGTLLAVLIAFRTDLIGMLRAVLGRHPGSEDEAAQARRLVGLLAVGTVPAGVAGILARDLVTEAFDRPLVVAAALVVTAWLLWWSERRRVALGTVEPSVAPMDGEVARDLAGTPWRTGVVVGAAQALAILPGISRSGATIAAGMSLGLSRSAAARFSFLLLLPVTLGAALVTLPDLASPPPGALPFSTWHVTLGIATSALSGYLAIRVLIALVSRRSLLVFARYVLVLAAVLAATALARG